MKRSADNEEKEEIESEEEYISVKQRKARKLETIQQKLTQERRENWARFGVSVEQQSDVTGIEESCAQTLVEQFRQLRAETTEDEKITALAKEEKQILEQVTREADAPLQGVKERAAGVVYHSKLQTSWKLPHKLITPEKKRELWNELGINPSSKEEDDYPFPLRSFRQMKLPRSLIQALKKKNILAPSPIQSIGIPVALQGRDVLGVAFTGSGKTLAFAIPLVAVAVEAELRLPLRPGEGPVGLCLCPSRELAQQTAGTIEFIVEAFARDLLRRRVLSFVPRVLCVIGGSSLSAQAAAVQQGIHVIVATPGRLGDLLTRRILSLAQCRVLVLDEADRLLDTGFEAEVRKVLDHLHQRRQTLLFSATMPRKVSTFAQSALVDPVSVNIGRAGAANLDILQEIEYVKQAHKMQKLLEALQKTGPPVMVFCDGQDSVDSVQEYLLLKNISAVGIHGGMAQHDRIASIGAFRRGEKDVLVGTDIAAKGLDFPEIRHVINFDMPKEIESFVHRIGRTGRGGRTGLATTFVNKDSDETALLDLRALLLEANQIVPLFLGDGGTQSSQMINEIRGCAYCGGLGHRIAQCPKLQQSRTRAAQGVQDPQTSRFHGGTHTAPEW